MKGTPLWFQPRDGRTDGGCQHGGAWCAAVVSHVAVSVWVAQRWFEDSIHRLGREGLLRLFLLTGSSGGRGRKEGKWERERGVFWATIPPQEVRLEPESLVMYFSFPLLPIHLILSLYLPSVYTISIAFCPAAGSHDGLPGHRLPEVPSETCRLG